MPSGTDLSSPAITGASVDNGASATFTNSDVSVNDAQDYINLTINDNGGAGAEPVRVSFDADVGAPSATGNFPVTADVDSNNDGSLETTGGNIDTLTLQSTSRTVTDGGTVYLGENDVDLTQISGVSAGSSATFTGVSGDADGSTASVGNTLEADITEANNFETGGYNTSGDSDGTADFFVVEPQVTDLTIYSGAGTGGADVTDGSIVTDTDTITVESEWNFDEAENVSITIEDEDGLEVQSQLTSNTGLLEIGESGGNVELSDVDSLDTGEYTVTVEGEDDLDGASRSATFTIRDESQSISLGQSSATQGDNVVATVTGTPGTYGLIRVEQSDTDDLEAGDANASQVFANTGDVQGRFGTDDLAGDQDEDYVGAVVDMDDDGEAQVRLLTNDLDTTTLDVEFVEMDSADTNPGTLQTAFNASADDSAELTVEEQSINISSAPSVVRIGEEFTIEGTAAESDEVKAYARIDQNYVPLVDEDGDWAEDDVDSNGEFSVDIDSGSNISLPDSYRIAIVADPVDDSGTNYLTGANQADEITSDTYSEFDTKSTTTVRTVEGDLTAQVSSQSIAANVGDEVTLSGTALGQGDNVRVYLIGPRGNFLDAAGNSQNAEEIDIDEEEFEEDYAAFSNRGQYTFIVVGQGRDGDYASDYGFGGDSLESDLTPQQAVAIVNDEYTGAGVDDQIVEITVSAENPQLSIGDFTTNGEVAQGEVTVSGTSNREDGTTVFVEVLGENDNVIGSDEAEVNGSTGEWSTTIDMSDVETGTYTLRADDDEASASLEFELVESVSTPTEEPTTDDSTPTDEPTPTDTPMTDDSTPTEEPATDDSTPTETSTSTPGFGVIVALIALIAAALIAVRRD